jgi:hypothetical protein
MNETFWMNNFYGVDDLYGDLAYTLYRERLKFVWVYIPNAYTHLLKGYIHILWLIQDTIAYWQIKLLLLS